MHFRSLLKALGASQSISDFYAHPEDAFHVPSSAAAFALAATSQSASEENIIAIVATRHQANELYDELVELVGEEGVRLFPSWETLPLERVSPAVDTMGKRLRVLNELSLGHQGNLIIVAPVRAVVQIIGTAALEAGRFQVREGITVSPEILTNWLSQAGYRREYQVEHRGEFAVRGSIVDVFPSHSDTPIRADFFGDEIDRLTSFDPSDQLSIDAISQVDLYPAHELVITDEVRQRALELRDELPYAQQTWERISNGMVFEGIESWLPWINGKSKSFGELLDATTRVVLFDPSRLRARAADLLQEEDSIVESLGATWSVPEIHAAFPRLFSELDSVLSDSGSLVQIVTTVPTHSDQSTIEARAVEFSSKDPEAIAAGFRSLLKNDNRIVLCSANIALARRLQETLSGFELNANIVDEAGLTRVVASPQASISIVISDLDRGAVFPQSKIVVAGQGDLTNRRRSHRVPRARVPRHSQAFDALGVGGYVVHNHHGVGRFAGMVKQDIGGGDRDYLLIEYRGDDKLYVPSDQMESITPYLGGETPSLSKLGGSDWQKTRSRVRGAVTRIAQELVVLYQKRITTRGFAFSPDSVWQKEMEDLFPYELTGDQAKAIVDVKADMEDERPMDRLICGDVGFGKTEVAIRAVFKAVQDAKQAAVLVPTTLLAQQHFQTFADRFASFPVRVEVVSRFLTPQQTKAVLEGLVDGSVDVVIGTHRLLGSDVKFSDLGLLVVDEEQHFGVTHKEAIKSIKAGIDVLTLTATPIPRTLEMSLTGIRDMSLLGTPPTKRQPILTYVGEYDERAVSEALRRELLREGQVFFVHNRVSDIEVVAQNISQLVPEARIAIAHGQLDEGTLEQTVLDFWEGRFDVLVCTTIIESGIDMPTVNTLIVDRADRLGLGQLHQLRGRVGRSGTRGYAYLFHPSDVALSEDAHERLKTIGENTELGSGFRIAMRDLEIRGAGNILGGDQSGHIAQVGYDLYVKMVEEAVKELKGEAEPAVAQVKLEIPVGANLPETYITRTDLRLEAYRRLSMCQSSSDVDEIEQEWIDRFGPPPNLAKSLLRLAKIRARAISANLGEIIVTGMGRSSVAKPTIRLSPVELKASGAIRMKRLFPKGIYKETEKALLLSISKNGDPIEAIEHALEHLVEL